MKRKLRKWLNKQVRILGVTRRDATIKIGNRRYIGKWWGWKEERI